MLLLRDVDREQDSAKLHRYDLQRQLYLTRIPVGNKWNDWLVVAASHLWRAVLPLGAGAALFVITVLSPASVLLQQLIS